MISETQMQDPQSSLLDAVVATALQPNNHELLRRLGLVLGIGANSRVLLVAEAAVEARRVLEEEQGCQVEVFHGDLRQLPYASAEFDSAIVALPIEKDLHAAARELSRVLKPNGGLGLVVFSIHREQMPDDDRLFAQVTPLLTLSRPAAVYRAVLAECGFTAFVSEDRKRGLRQTLASYRQHLVSPEGGDTAQEQPRDALAQALDLLTTGGVGVTLITAEKGL